MFIVLQGYVVVWRGVVCGWVVVMVLMMMMITIIFNLNVTTLYTHPCNKIFAEGFIRHLSSLQRRWSADYVHVAPNGATNAGKHPG